MKRSIFCLLILFCAASCQKKQSATSTIKPQDIPAESPYSRVEVYEGQTIDSQSADGCGTLSRKINETFTVSYLKGDTSFIITGNTHIINNPCIQAADSGYKSFGYSRIINSHNTTKFLFTNNVTHVYETIEFRNDSFFINVQNWRCNTNDNCYFRGKRK